MYKVNILLKPIQTFVQNIVQTDRYRRKHDNICLYVTCTYIHILHVQGFREVKILSAVYYVKVLS